jgi:hypothetical protein
VGLLPSLLSFFLPFLFLLFFLFYWQSFYSCFSRVCLREGFLKEVAPKASINGLSLLGEYEFTMMERLGEVLLKSFFFRGKLAVGECRFFLCIFLLLCDVSLSEWVLQNSCFADQPYTRFSLQVANSWSTEKEKEWAYASNAFDQTSYISTFWLYLEQPWTSVLSKSLSYYG